MWGFLKGLFSKKKFTVEKGTPEKVIVEVGKEKGLTTEEINWLVLYYSEDLTYLQVMEILDFDMSIDTLRRRMKRAKEKIES